VQDGQVGGAPAKGVTWTRPTGGPGESPEFPITLGPLPDREGPLVFNVVQTYSNGDVVNWEQENLPGIEAEFPVLQTEYGNIAVSTVQLDPFVFAAFAMRGVEIMFRTATLFSPDDVKATARYHTVYSAMSNITFPPDSPVAAMGGQSLIVSPRGEVLAEDPTNNEGIIEATIPIAEFRKNRRIPRYPLEVVAPVFE